MGLNLKMSEAWKGRREVIVAILPCSRWREEGSEIMAYIGEPKLVYLDLTMVAWMDV